MKLPSRLILTALAATMLLALAVSAAGARNLSTNERNFELIWNESLGSPKTKLRFTAGGTTVACKVTLLGHFVESTIKKETAIRQGAVSHGELESCTGGGATIRTETLPWEGRYRGFTGTLPRIRSTTSGLIRAVVLIEANGHLCEMGTEVNHPGVDVTGNSAEAPETGFETTGEPENITAERNNRIPLGGEFVCFFSGEGTYEGIALIRNLPRTGKLRITLI